MCSPVSEVPTGSPLTRRLSEVERDFVREVCRRFHPAGVLFSYVFTADHSAVLDELGKTCKMILTYDVRYLREAALVKIGSYESYPVWTREEETAVLSKADLVIAIQWEDEACFKQMVDPRKVVCVPLPVPYKPRRCDAIPGRCLYVGSGHTQNATSLQWFLDHVWPLVMQRRPSAQLHVCGSVCGTLSRVPAGVVQRGFVRDLDAEYGAAQLVVVPLIVGSGLKIKLMDAWSHGLPVVSTSVGLQGVADLALRNEAAILEDTPERFAAAVIRILADPELRQAMASGVKNLVQEHFSPTACCRDWWMAMQTHLRKIDSGDMQDATLEATPGLTAR